VSCLSVILCLAGDLGAVPRIFDALALQSIDACRFELVVVADESDACSREVLLAGRQQLPTTVVSQRPAGIAAARNLAIFVARHPVLLFLRNDEIPGGDCLLAHLAAHLAQPDEHVFVTGPLAPPCSSSLLTDCVLEREAKAQTSPKGEVPSDEFRPFAGRFSCKREMLIKHGIYDPDYGCDFEHMELEQRLLDKGRRWILEPRASSSLWHCLDFDRLWLRFYQFGRQQVRQAAEHPSRRDSVSLLAQTYNQSQGAFARRLRQLRRADQLAQSYADAGLVFDTDAATLIQGAYRRQLDLAQSKGVADALGDGWDRHRPVRLREVGLDRVEAGAPLNV
jgi:glycosyltransferase involved in cell wall biosynthesis